VRAEAPFQPDDLAELDERLLSRAARVVSLRQAWEGQSAPDALQMRHDVDGYTPRAWETAQAFAEWEHERGYTSSYYLLHTAAYWGSEGFTEAVQRLEILGHEVGLHNDALGYALEWGGNPREILKGALRELRATGARVTSVVAHGNPHCERLQCSNDELFIECRRPTFGSPRRSVRDISLRPTTLEKYRLDFEGARTLARERQLTDSAGRWPDETLDSVQDQFDDPHRGQLHINLHPDWWAEALL
jgi:hypothetical protein